MDIIDYCFSDTVIDNLKYYVYCLADPRDNKVFYIGKGKGNRVFAHALDALNTTDMSLKLDTIRSIINNDMLPKCYILRHGLTEETAFEMESILIDFLSYADFNMQHVLTNDVAGHHQWDRGIKSVDEIKEIYDCPEINPDDAKDLKLIAININGTYKRGMGADDLYEATRKAWVLNPDKANKADYLLAVYKGIIRGVFVPNGKWYDSGERSDAGNIRYAINAHQIDDARFQNKKISGLFPIKKGQANPIRYNY